MKILYAIAAIIAIAEATTPAGVPCLSDSDCMMTECCYKKHDDLVVSRRQVVEPWHPTHQKDYTHVRGVCQSYKMEGDYCSIFDKTNGYCSCNENMGMKCQYVHDPVNFNSKKRQFSSGSYRCTQLLVSK